MATTLALGDNWKLELPFDFVSKFTCYNCGEVEPIRKPLQEIKKGQTKCSKCGEPHREATEYFQVTSESEDADQTFGTFGLCEREILLIQGNKIVEIELFHP